MKTIRIAAPGALLTLGAVLVLATLQACSDGGGGEIGQPDHTHTLAVVQVAPESLTVGVGATAQLEATPKCDCGEALDLPVSWTSADPAVATVDASGQVTGVVDGTVDIIAEARDVIFSVTGHAALEVAAPISRIVIWGLGTEPIGVGLTVQLTATPYDSVGQELDGRIVTWASSDETLATVDEHGMLTTLANGDVTIKATSEGVSGTAELKITGETATTEGGYNLSWPVVFAEGIGLTGQAVSADPGVRPTVEEGITVDTLPFWWEENVPTLGDYYEQGTANTWRAEYIDGTGQPAYEASAYWGDNLTAKEWSAGTKVRVEVALSATGVGTLEGFNMTYLFGSGANEMQGTDGSTADFVPLLYTVGPTLIVEKLDGEGGAVSETVADATIGSEVTVSGRAVYGYQLQVTTEGWYRLRFVLAQDANATLTAVGNTGDLLFVPTVVSAKETALEIHVTAG